MSKKPEQLSIAPERIQYGWLNTKEAAFLAGIHPKVLERLARKKRVPHGVVPGSKKRKRVEYRYKWASVDRALQRGGFDGRLD